MRKVFIQLSFALVFLLGSIEAFSQVIENYNPKILEEYSMTSRISNSKIELDIDLNQFPESSFRFMFPSESSIFLGEMLWFHTKEDTTFIINHNDLRALASANDTIKTRLTILKNGIKAENVSVEKGFFKNYIKQVIPDNTGIFIPDKRIKDNFNDFFFFAAISILFMLGVYKLIYPMVLKLILMPTSVFSAEDFSDTNSVQKFFSLDVIFYLLLMNMMAFLLMMLIVKTIGMENLQFLISGDINQLFLTWLVGSVLLILLSVLKFTLQRFLGFIFDLNKVVIPHFFYMLRIISITIFVIAFILSIIVLNGFFDLEITVRYLVVTFFWIYIVGILMLYLIMSNRGSFKNYHLFVYICTAEIVPFLILSKVIIG